MSSSITSHVKFIREQGGSGPNCYPGSLGEADRDQCLDKVFRKMEYEMNRGVQQAFIETTVPAVSSAGMLGDAFYRPKEGSPGGGGKSMYGVFQTALADEARFKNSYNDNHRKNYKTIPPVSGIANNALNRIASRANAIGTYSKVFDAHEGEIRACYCAEYIQTTCNWLDIPWDTPEENDAPEDPAKEVSDPATDGSNRDNLLGEQAAIPIVVGRTRVLAKLIELRGNELLFGVCQKTATATIHKVWFNTTLVFSRGALKTKDATYITADNTTHRDLLCLRIGGADINNILFKHKGIVYVEVITDNTDSGAITQTYNNTTLLFSDATNNLFVLKQADGTVVVHNSHTIPASSFSATVIGSSDAVYDYTAQAVYWRDKKADLLSGGVETAPVLLTGPVGVAQSGVRFNNHKYTSGTGVRTFKYPPAEATLFIADIGFNFTTRKTYLMDVVTGTVVPNNLPADFVLSFWLHSVSTHVIYLFSTTGTVWAISDQTGEFLSHADIGVCIPRVNDRIPAGDVVLLSPSGTVRLFSPDLMQCADTAYSVPVVYTKFSITDGTFIGQTSGGEVVVYRLQSTSGASAANFAAALSADLDGAVGGDLSPISGYSAEDPSISYLDYARNFAYSYNKTVYAYADNTTGLYIATNSLQQEVHPLLIKDTRIDAVSFTEDTSEVAREVTLNARDKNYADIQVKVSGTGVDGTLTTTAIMSTAGLNALSTAYIARLSDEEAGKTQYVCALAANLEAVNGGNVYRVEQDVSTNQAKITVLPYTPLPTEVPLPVYEGAIEEAPVFNSATLPGFFTTYAQTGREVTCAGHNVGALLTPLTRKAHHYVTQDDTTVDIEFLSPPVGLHTTVDYLELLDDPFLNLFCVGGEWVQYTTLTVRTPAIITLAGLLRGRFLTFPNEVHAVGTPVHFYDNTHCLHSLSAITTAPLDASAEVDVVEYRYKAVVSNEDIFQFGTSADDPNYEYEFSFKLEDLYIFMFARNNGFMTVDTLFNDRWYVPELKAYLQLERRPEFYAWRADKSIPVYSSVDWSSIHAFFLGRGVANTSNKTYTIKMRTFIGTRLTMSRFNNRRFAVRGFIDGKAIVEQPSYSGKYVYFDTEFNPYKETFTYAVSSV